MFQQLSWLQHFSAWPVRAQLGALATEVAAAMARLAIATSAAAKEDRRSPDGNGGAGTGWPIPWEQLGDWRAVWDENLLESYGAA